MINYSKKIDDPPLPPILWDKKLELSHLNTPYKPKLKSLSQHTDISFLQDSTLNTEVSILRNTFK